MDATALIDEGFGTIPLIGHKIIKFPVDDGIKKLVAQIETSKNIASVRLFHGRARLTGKILGNVALYEIDDPSDGDYFFLIPSGSGDYRYEVTAKLEKPIAFSAKYFVDERGDFKAVSNPIIGML